jgi:cytochrome c oxidase subunit 3
MNAMNRLNVRAMQFWLGVTVLLGLAFLILEIYEFVHYVHEGHTFTSSAFGSSFYALVGTHGAHVTFGICWIIGLMIQTARRGLTYEMAPKLFLSSLYWHFIDVVWVFIFTLVYLLGKVG